MDQTQIYIKTPAGELAMSERTRVVQRNLRMVLVMVDGRAVVADLVARIGNRTLVENALLELEEGGFITRVSKPQDESGKDAPSGTASKPASAAATRSGSPFPTPVPGARVRPVAAAKAWKPAPPSEPPLSRARYAPASRPDLGRPAPVQRPVAATFDFSLSPAGMMPPPVTEIAAEVPMPEYREGHGRKIGLAVLVLVLLLPLVALLFPYTAFFRDDLEKAISLHLGLPVQFESVGIQVLPRPALVLDNVRIGIEGKTRIKRVLLPNGITPWHGPHPLLPEVVLEGLELDTEMLTRLPRLFAGNGQQNSPYRVGHLKLRDLTLGAGSHVFNGGLGDVTFTPEGALEKIVLETASLTLRAQLAPLPDSLPGLVDPAQPTATSGSGRLSVLIDGGGWPEKAARKAGEKGESSTAGNGSTGGTATGLQFDSLQANGILEGGKLTLERFSGRLLEGQVKGQVLLGWSQQTAFSAALEANHIHAQGLARVFGSSFQVAGHLSGSLTLQGVARDWPELLATVRGNGQFAMSQGAINGLNLVDAVRRQPGQTVVGGSTRFEQMTGNFEISRNRLLLNNLVLQAGLMQGAGNLAIADNDHVDGLFTVTFGRFAGGRSQRARVYGPAGSMVAEASHSP